MNSKYKQGNIMVNGENIKTVDTAKYLGDKFNSKGNYTDLCKDRVDRAKGSTFELIALCKQGKFGTRQIENMLILYQSVFLPRLIHNCESWSNMTPKDYKSLAICTVALSAERHGGFKGYSYCCIVLRAWNITYKI